MKNNLIVTVIIVVIVAAGAGFFGGMQYQKMQPSSNAVFTDRQVRFGGGQGRFGQNGMRPVVGQIISSDNNSITVKLMDGSTKIVIVSASTAINKSATGTIGDLKTGQTVAVFGTQNSDGSVTAQNVQLNPQMRFRGPGPSGEPAPTQ